MRGKNVSRKHRRGAPRTRKHRRARRQSGGAVFNETFQNLDLFSEYLQRHPHVSKMQAFPVVYNGDFYQGAITDEMRNKPSTLVLYNSDHTYSITITDVNIMTFTFLMYDFKTPAELPLLPRSPNNSNANNSNQNGGRNRSSRSRKHRQAARN